MALALFDFDGTVTHKDSMLPFLKFCVPVHKYILNLIVLMPKVVLYYLGFIDSGRLKSAFLKRFFNNWTEDRLNISAETYYDLILKHDIRPFMAERIDWHINKGDDVYLVTASSGIWVQPFCKEKGIGCISTEMEFENGRFTGKLTGKNCKGKEKTIRIKSELHLEKYDRIYAYGDSKADKPMLELATDAFFRQFNFSDSSAGS